MSLFTAIKFFPTHFFACLVVINTKTAVAKWQKPSTAAAAAGQQQPNILYMQCVRDGVQQTAMQYRKMGVRAGHITSVCRVAELPLSILAELALPITFPTSSSASYSEQYQPPIWSTSWFTFPCNPEALYYYLNVLLFHTPHAYWSHWDSVHENSENRYPEDRPVASSNSHWINN